MPPPGLVLSKVADKWGLRFVGWGFPGNFSAPSQEGSRKLTHVLNSKRTASWNWAMAHLLKHPASQWSVSGHPPSKTQAQARSPCHTFQPLVFGSISGGKFFQEIGGKISSHSLNAHSTPFLLQVTGDSSSNLAAIV